MVELRKRKPADAPAPTLSTKKAKATTSSSKATPTANTRPSKPEPTKAAPKPSSQAPQKSEAKPTASTASTAPTSRAPKSLRPGDILEPTTLHLPLQTHDDDDDNSTSLSTLLASSKQGIIIFTYPKASTPGCTTQASLFRDSFTALTQHSGLSVYGLSRDKAAANGRWAEKLGLQYGLLSDTEGKVVKALGFGKEGGKTARGVVVLGKEGVVRVHEVGGPARTVEVVRELVEGEGGDGEEVPGREEVEEAEREEKTAAVST